MKIDHVAMYVDDLEKTKTFYEKYFGAKANAMYHNPNTGLRTYFLTFDDGNRLEIMSRPDAVSTNKELKSMGYIHLAINVGSKDKVNQLTDQLRSDGFKIISEPRTTGDGYYESCVLDPENNQIELVA